MMIKIKSSILKIFQIDLKLLLLSFIVIIGITYVTTTVLGQSDETNNTKDLESYPKYNSLDVVDMYFENNTLSHNKDFVNNITLHYVTGGKGDPVLLLHGWPETWYEWKNIIPSLIENNYTVIAPDMRGFGDSDKPLAGYDTKTVAKEYLSINKEIRF